MRQFEIIQLVAVAVGVVLPVLLGARLKRARMAGALVVAMVVQLVVEGFRWQLWPLELATIGMAIGDVVVFDRAITGLQRFRRAVLGPVGVVLLAALPAALPIPEMPVPQGPYVVGTQTFVVIDDERLEEYGLPEAAEGEEAPEPSEPRMLVVQAWYPASSTEGEDRLVWNPDWDVVGPAMADRLGYPGFFLSHADVLGWSYDSLPAVSGRLPVVIYSHGWTGFRSIAVNQMETLASRGFIVLAADHTYGSIASVFPNGEVVELDPRALPEHVDDGGEASDETYDEAAEELLETFSDDLASIVDGLEQGATGPFSRLRAEVDLDRIGVFGHSTGGGAAVRFCIEDERCRAVLGWDAWVNPIPDRIVARELGQPSLFARSDEWRQLPNDGRLRGLAERSPEASHWIGIDGAGHNDFVAVPLFSPVADRLGLKGPIPADRIVPILDSYLVGFFERYLLGSGGVIFDGASPPEVSYEYLP